MSYARRLATFRTSRNLAAVGAARRLASGESGMAARRDAAILARRSFISPAPRYQFLRRPSLARRGGYSFTNNGGKELNFVDTTSFADATTTGSVLLLNGMAQGTTASTRIGRQIQMKSVHVNVQFAAEADLGAPGAHVHWALVYDMQTNAATPAYTDIYDAVLPTAARNVSNEKRFRVLAQGHCIITGRKPVAAEEIGEGQKQYVDKFLKIPLVTQYNAGVAGTVGDIQTGGLFFVFCSDIAAGTGDVDTVGTIRVRYTD